MNSLSGLDEAAITPQVQQGLQAQVAAFIREVALQPLHSVAFAQGPQWLHALGSHDRQQAARYAARLHSDVALSLTERVAAYVQTTPAPASSAWQEGRQLQDALLRETLRLQQARAELEMLLPSLQKHAWLATHLQVALQQLLTTSDAERAHCLRQDWLPLLQRQQQHLQQQCLLHAQDLLAATVQQQTWQQLGQHLEHYLLALPALARVEQALGEGRP